MEWSYLSRKILYDFYYQAEKFIKKLKMAQHEKDNWKRDEDFREF